MISYSHVLQGKAKPPIKILTRANATNESADDALAANASEQGASTPPVTNSSEKTETNGMVKKVRRNKPNRTVLSDFVLVPSTSTIQPIAQGKSVVNSRPTKFEKPIPKASAHAVQGNLLDSDAPQLHKGKYRENKNKKPTTMKKLILKGREERKNAAQEQVSENLASEQPQMVIQPAKSVHSRKFRNYCDNMISKELNEVVELMISDLVRFQDRQHQKDAEKAKLKKRMVYGLREVKKLLKVDKIRCLIVAPNIENIQTEGGLDDMLGEILNDCRSNNVPYFFAMSRHALGYVTRKRRPLSVVGVLNYQGTEQHFKRIMEIVEQLREDYKRVNEGVEEADYRIYEEGVSANVVLNLPEGSANTCPILDYGAFFVTALDEADNPTEIGISYA